MYFFKGAVIILTCLLLVSCHYNLKKKIKVDDQKHKFKRQNNKALDEMVEIETENGVVQGSKMTPYMYGFRGIPYAKPPVGDLRFESPQKPENWTGTWNATYDRSQCVQNHIDSFLSLLRPVGNEDCLYINVYIQQLPQQNVSLPVMVWIYGGAFIIGNSSYSLYPPDYLVQRDVIVVSFNYRLGIFGFLSTNDESAPGNGGLKDQILALKWVQRNIKAFGGNPDNVTLFGGSAGGVSISYLTMSPLTKGLYKNVIMESGTALCMWGLSKTSREAAYNVGLAFGIHPKSSRDLVDQLKKIPANQLQIYSQVVMSLILARDPLNGWVYGPVIESPSDDAVVVDYSYERLRNGNFIPVPAILGYNSAEAEILRDLLQFLQLYLVSYKLLPARLVPIDMNAARNNLDKIGRLIKKHYGGNIVFPNNGFVRYLSDDLLVRPIQKTAVLSSQYTDVYLYRFSYTKNPNATGAAHGDELGYLFKSNKNNTEDRKITRCIVDLWTNFAKYNDPTPTDDFCGGIIWKPMTPDDRNATYYINIDRNTTAGENPNKEDIDFWEGLYDEYGNPPFSTY